MSNRNRSALPALCLSLLFTSAFSVQAEDAPAPAAEKPVERQPLPERSQEEASALERKIPQQEQQQLQAGSDSFLALWKPANSAEPEGVVIIVPGAGENADWPQAIGPLRRKLPDANWGSLSLSLPDVSMDTLPPRVMEAPNATVDTSSKDASTADKPIEQAASAEAEGTDPAVVPGCRRTGQDRRLAHLCAHRCRRGLCPDPERTHGGAGGPWHGRLVGGALPD